MPKSKRDKKVSLTQTQKKGLELKQRLIEKIRDTVDQYERIFIFSVNNMRNAQLKDVRTDWKGSRFFFGKNKVMIVALGKSKEDEHHKNLFKVSRHLRGQMGLMFTNEPEDKVLRYFDELYIPDYARSGSVAVQTVILEEGPLPSFSHALEPQLRQLGLPTQLKRGIIHLLRDHTVCEKGQVLNPEQCRILKQFGHKMADFHVTVTGIWNNTGKFKALKDKDRAPKPSVPDSVRVKPKDDEDQMEFDNDDNDDEQEGEDVEDVDEDSD